VIVLKDLLEFVGIEGDRLNLVWVSSAEAPRFAEEMTGFIEKVRALGPLNWTSKRQVAAPDLLAAAADK
jgi:coenzyme F420-reducing hydrogenase delta subunit